MAVDASLIEADANKQNSTPKEGWDAASIDPADAPRAVREYLDTLDEAAFGAASEVLREHGRHPYLIVDPEADKPAEHQVVIHLLHELPLGSDRKQDLEQTRPDKPFRRDRRATEIGVKRLKFAIETGERVIDHLPDLAQRVSRRDALFQIDIAEQRPARLVRPAHLHPRRYRAEDDSCSQIVVEAGLFQ